MAQHVGPGGAAFEVPGTAFGHRFRDYLIPRRPILEKIVHQYTGGAKKVADLPWQIRFTLSNGTTGASKIAALYAYESPPTQTYMANYPLDIGKTAAVAMPANIGSFIVYDASKSQWIPICTVLVGTVVKNAGGTLKVTDRTSGGYQCSF